jgi:guanylate kinase
MDRIILCGEGAGGKDFLKVKLLEKGYSPSISYTTRPPRPGETEGVNYHFISVEEFLSMVKDGLFREWNIFGDKKWYYGTSHAHFNKARLFIMTPSGIRALTPEERSESVVVYINIDEDVRRDRLSKRNDADDVERRLGTDRADFRDFADYDLKITNELFDPEEVFNMIQNVAKQTI